MELPRRLAGFFIVVEGIDGCGSTTHSKRLAKALRGEGREARLTCEPTTGPIGALIRHVLQKRLFVPDAEGPRAFAWSTMALLFAADRLDHLDSTVIPVLREGGVVVSDRYDLSSLAYQSATAQDADRAIPWIRELNAFAVRPDLTILLEVPVEVAEERRGGRGGLEEIFEARDVQRRVAEMYARAEELVPGDRLVRVSGLGTIEEVGARILEVVHATDFGAPSR